MWPFGSTASLLILLLPLTGDLSDVGLRIKRGAELAVEEATASGVPLSLWVADTGGNPEQASALLISLKVEEGTVVVGPLTQGELKSIDALTHLAIPVVSPTVWADQPGRWFTTLSPSLEGQALARWAAGRWKVPRVAVVWPAESYGREALGGWRNTPTLSPVVALTYQSGQVDFRRACLLMGGWDVEEIKKEFDADRRAAKIRMLRVVRHVLEGKKLAEKFRVGVLPPVIEGRQVQQEELDKEVVKGVRDAVVQERGGVVEALEVEKGLAPEAVAADWLNDPAHIAVIQPQIREYAMPVGPSGDDLGWFTLSFPRIRERPVLVAIEAVVYWPGAAEPEHFQTLLTLVPRRLQNPWKLDAVYVPGDGADAIQLLAQLRFYEMGVAVLGSQRWHRDEFVKNVGKFPFEITVPTVFFGESADERVAAFVKFYVARYVEEPDRYSALGYDAARLALQVAKRQPPAPAFTGSGEFQGVTGTVKVEGGRVVERRVKFLTIRRGQWREFDQP